MVTTFFRLLSKQRRARVYAGADWYCIQGIMPLSEKVSRTDAGPVGMGVLPACNGSNSKYFGRRSGIF
jgi:hypothetical protein